MSALTATEWKQKTSLDYGSFEDDVIEEKIIIAQALVESHIGYGIEATDYVENGLGRFDAENRLFLVTKNSPINSIASLQVTQVADIIFDEGNIEINYDTGFIKTELALHLYLTPTLQGRLFNLRSVPTIVTYNAGYIDVPNILKIAIARTVDFVFALDKQQRSQYNSKTGTMLTSFSLGDLSESYSPNQQQEREGADNSILPKFVKELLRKYVKGNASGRFGIV